MRKGRFKRLYANKLDIKLYNIHYIRNGRVVKEAYGTFRSRLLEGLIGPAGIAKIWERGITDQFFCCILRLASLHLI